ncbi:MAG: hypothetical protein KDI03_15200 [Anaerolineae bacterium]|nr:hypothetical protein [Anaerolineae bacterium]
MQSVLVLLQHVMVSAKARGICIFTHGMAAVVLFRPSNAQASSVARLVAAPNFFCRATDFLR